jgi:hypothetical protein
MKANWTESNIHRLVLESNSKTEVLLKLGLRCAGSNFKTLEKYIIFYNIRTDHFEKNYNKLIEYTKRIKINLSDILINGSSYSRRDLKKRLYDENILERKCCLCGQDENWNGMKISLILDHINGVHNDNRIENLRIVCPNCNAGLDTFAGKNSKTIRKKYYCVCGSVKNKKSNKCKKCTGEDRRKVERPNIEDLIKEVEEFGYSAVGRKYSVSDNAVRKWIKNK